MYKKTEKGSKWLHDPSQILSSFVKYEVTYLGNSNAKGSGDKRDAERVRRGNQDTNTV